MRVISLGSGSSGNALLVQSGETSVLVDAGFPARLLAGRLRSLGIAPASLSAILLTHEHGDHSCGALSLACQHGIPILSDPRTIDALLKQPSREARPAGWTPERVELPVGARRDLAHWRCAASLSRTTQWLPAASRSPPAPGVSAS